jgi:hypothetical protein
MGCFPLHNHPANGKESGPIPEEMSQTLLIKKKQENLDWRNRHLAS